MAIPGGVWSEGAAGTDQLRREVTLRAVTGEDEAFLLESADDLAPSLRATALLERCIDEPDVAASAHALTVGDREALLLHLRRLTIGETLDCVLACPADSCGERMELALPVAGLMVPPYRDVRREHELTVDVEGARYAITFRLPSAADLDAIGPIARRDPEMGAAALAERCISRVTRDDAPLAAAELTTAARAALAEAMAERDPQAEIELELTCPACGTAFSALFDTASFFVQELEARAAQLLHEVHTLAWHYHWSERDILQMPRRRRERYLAMVADRVARTRAG
ncbi:MAG TPA: hypothetical protein VF461_14830 [Gemmatimonadaceae bacterium]